jgi:hypothetical protein
MKKILATILGNPKTSLMGLFSAIVPLLLYYKVITLEESVLYLGVIGAILGLASKDGNANKEAEDSIGGGIRNPTKP